MRETSDRPAHPTRRSLLLGSLAAMATACTADPRIGGGAPTGSPRPTNSPGPASTGPSSAAPQPTPTFAGAATGAGAETDLAARAAGLSRAWTDELSADARGLFDGIVDAHLVHAAALSSPEPTSRPTAASPSTTPRKPKDDDLDEALRRLAAREATVAADHRERALAATGFSALLWASMAVAAAGFAEVVREADSGDDLPAFAKTPPRHDLPTVTDTAAIQDLVTQLHAAVYGYQLAIGQLDSGAAKDRALARLKHHRQLRDTLIAALTARSADVPVAAPAYVPSVRPSTPARAVQLIRKIERALLPFVGLWLASAPHRADRLTAFTTLTTTDAAARSWGAGLLVWPGWNG